MAKRKTMTECFAYFGAKPAAIRTAWSAISEDGKTVVITLWQDRLKREGNGVLLYDAGEEPSKEWIERPGNRQRMRHLRWALDNCGGRVRVIVTKARDTAAIPRAIEECFPHPTLTMRIERFDESTGSFRVVSVA